MIKLELTKKEIEDLIYALNNRMGMVGHNRWLRELKAKLKEAIKNANG